MGLWLLRTIVLKFKGKLAKFIIALVVLFVVLNFLLLKRPETQKIQNIRNDYKDFTDIEAEKEKPLSSEIESNWNQRQKTPTEDISKWKSGKEYWNLSRRRNGKETKKDTLEFDSVNHAVESKLEQLVVKEGYLNTVKNTAKEDYRPHIKPVETKQVDKLQQESLETYDQELNALSEGKQERISDPYFCPELFISRLEDVQYSRCRPHRPSPMSCLYAQQLYYLDKNLTKCEGLKTERICTVSIDKTDQEQLESNVHVVCDRYLCSEKWYSFSLAVWTLESRNGGIQRLKSFSSMAEMEKVLPQILMENIKKGVYFLVLKCSRRKDGGSISQLLIIDPWLTIKRRSKAQNSRSKNAINVNILLLDSVSRAHFYRSLPKTINLFKNWSSSDLAPAHFFDFELFQAVHGHTAENTHALFTGRSLPPHLEDEYPPVEMGYTFGRFVKAGYQTLWQEDLCWRGGWGLMTDLGVMEWDELKSNLRKNFIDSIGITHSSCEVLSTYKLESPFNGPPGDKICYNGKFQHEYLLNYTMDTLDAIKYSPKALPLLSYMSLSVGHDNNGRRIQTLDQALTEYVDKLGKDKNTLTIVLADHGNTYTEYTVASLEGRYEMYHPSLFIIVPKNVAKILGNEALRALRTNQRRLVNMYDLHHTLMALVDPLGKGRVPLQGIFTPISGNRTCNDIELQTPNLCVCDGWDSPTTNDTLKIALVEFAVGQLNNQMDNDFVEGLKGKKNRFPLLKSCRRLIPVQFRNVRERISREGLLRTSMDINVKSVEDIPEKTETFHVEIESKETPDSNSMDLKLVHFDRMSVFEKYKGCADAGVSPLLCICSSTSGRYPGGMVKGKIDPSSIKDNLDSFEAEASVEILDEQECLLFIRRHHLKQSLSFEFVNLCLDSDISVFVSALDLDNMKISRNLPMELTVRAGSMRFAFSARKDLSYWDSSFEIKTEITSIRKI